MISEDVIHSFFVPAFRIKQDVLPGRYSTLWFEATKPGDYHLFCAEYCGTDHSRMMGKVVVQTPEEYARWLADENSESAGATRPPLGRSVELSAMPRLDWMDRKSDRR